MTSQCARRTFKIYTIKKTGVLTIVILGRYNNCNSSAHLAVSFDSDVQQTSPPLSCDGDVINLILSPPIWRCPCRLVDLLVLEHGASNHQVVEVQNSVSTSSFSFWAPTPCFPMASSLLVLSALTFALR